MRHNVEKQKKSKSDRVRHFDIVSQKSIHAGLPRRRHLWERNVFLIQAPDQETACLKADQFARDKQISYLNDRGETVSWVFQEIEEIKLLDDETLTDGSEVDWHFFERVDPVSSS
jgi:hypothetical protein